MRLPGALAFSSSSPSIASYAGQSINGLLGLTVLSSFHRVTLEFASGQIALSGSPGSGAPVAAIAIIGGAIVILVLALVWVLRRERLAKPRASTQIEELKA